MEQNGEKEIIKSHSYGLFSGIVITVLGFIYSHGDGLTYNVGIVLFIFGAVFSVLSSKISITVTDKRVYGRTLLRGIDLPIDSISAVGTFFPQSLTVSTSSGTIHFTMLMNRDEVLDSIRKLILNRQETSRATAPIVQTPQSAADELKKYKELLDDGIITQEEFNAKKKQLLGL